MKNVLIVTYYFPPSNAVGGLRPYGLAKYLPDFGWNPIVLTPYLSRETDLNCRIIQTPYEDVTEIWKKRMGLNPKKDLNEQFNASSERKKSSIINKIAFIPGEIITYPDAQKGWYMHAVKAGDELLKTEEIDAIISTSKPETCHLIAKTLSEKYGVPWIADFRDLWTQNPYFDHSVIRKFFERELEVKTIGKAHALVTVTKPWVYDLKQLFPLHPVYNITNGFDPDILNNNQDTNMSDIFTITYTGVLYGGKRDPALLFKAVQNLIEKNVIDPERIEIRFFGSTEPWLDKEISERNLGGIVQLCGNIPRFQALEKQRESQLLLMLLWNDPMERGTVPAKIFEYFAARRPIIAIGGNGESVVKDLINETKTGYYVTDLEQLERILTEYYLIYEEHGCIAPNDPREVNRYNQVEMAKKFADILNKVSGREIT